MNSYTFANIVLQNQQMTEEKIKGSTKTVALLLPKPSQLENNQTQNVPTERPFDFDTRYRANDLLKGAVNISAKSTVESVPTCVKRKYTPICYILEDISPPKSKAPVLQTAPISTAVNTHDTTGKAAEPITLMSAPQSESMLLFFSSHKKWVSFLCTLFTWQFF
jgi:hypothetical protein